MSMAKDYFILNLLAEFMIMVTLSRSPAIAAQLEDRIRSNNRPLMYFWSMIMSGCPYTTIDVSLVLDAFT